MKNWIVCLLLVIFITITGCQNQSQSNNKSGNIVPDTDLQKAISKCLDSTGCNAKEWSFDADAVATIYEDECKTLIAQHHLFNCCSGKTEVTIDSIKASEKVSESISANDKLQLNGMLCHNNSMACTAARLKIYMVALTSLNTILDNKELNLEYVTMEDKGGSCCHIIETKGNILACCRNHNHFSKDSPYDTLRIWIDDETGYIKRIWISYIKDPETGEYGYIAANISNYLLQKNGMKLPTSMEFIPSDCEANDSGISMLKIDLQRFRFPGDMLSSSAG